ncbi:hypothetical protein M427DRAFT_58023 [Gonapodya prolifera JEL478]|uniref:Homoserine dehydrogenase n=1 Tax=Gonapodya prolifera (strain JEL478) TaxID=1344416 RepID=A0A139ABI0_GONPJ|nr:hypothetical protein M427DRAFT_58023 [Gonapodya prolifera JEL478]|eukprot:KXS14029.1 hypothetical protein M427DRAFT_58023 [Gonapodya prolifera JEL478]
MVFIGFIGPGGIGSEVLRQLQVYNTRNAHALPVVAILDIKNLLLHTPTPDSRGIDLDTWKDTLYKAPENGLLDGLVEHMKKHQPAVLVDCTASQHIASLYPSFLRSGFHIVTPNKKAFSGDLSLFREIRELTHPTPGRARYPMCYHESSVGAGLPLIQTLNDLVRTGDKITRIEGIFSGTLSYIFNNFSPVQPSAAGPPTFSSIVRTAKQLGYTEPDPRDDLNGLDVARKVVIVGRLAGHDLELGSLSVENIVPEELRGVKTADEFLGRLPDHDAYFKGVAQEAGKEGKVLRYVGVFDAKEGSGVKLMRYPTSHPFASLQGSDNIVAIYTEWSFPKNPLIIIGAGAGAPVTAFGIFSDILKIQDRVGYAGETTVSSL